MNTKVTELKEGMVFKNNCSIKGTKQNDFHVKLIVPHIISTDVFVDSASLVYLYSGETSIIKHSFFNLVSICTIHLNSDFYKYFKCIGIEGVNDWERNMDIAYASYKQGVWITKEQISNYKKNHLIISTESNRKYIAIPFFDIYNKQLDHIPIIHLSEGIYSPQGLFKEANAEVQL